MMFRNQFDLLSATLRLAIAEVIYQKAYFRYRYLQCKRNFLRSTYSLEFVGREQFRVLRLPLFINSLPRDFAVAAIDVTGSLVATLLVCREMAEGLYRCSCSGMAFVLGTFRKPGYPEHVIAGVNVIIADITTDIVQCETEVPGVEIDDRLPAHVATSLASV